MLDLGELVQSAARAHGSCLVVSSFLVSHLGMGLEKEIFALYCNR